MGKTRNQTRYLDHMIGDNLWIALVSLHFCFRISDLGVRSSDVSQSARMCDRCSRDWPLAPKVWPET